MTEIQTRNRSPQPKPWIEAIHAYVPGKSKGSDGRELTKLSANENPLGCSAQALAALGRGGDPARYPDPDATALREAIARLHGLDAARIVCGTGSDELLNLAAQGFAGPGEEVLYARFPSWSTKSPHAAAARRRSRRPMPITRPTWTHCWLR